MARCKTIFIGTPAFGIPTLEALFTDPYFEIVAVVSQPDRPVGRTQQLTPTPIKTVALRHRAQVFQPEKIKDILPVLTELQPDLIVVVAYAQIIPESVLNLPQFGCINIHASLLPKYRGAAVLQAPILHGDEQSGITIMKMDRTLDTGPIISQHPVSIIANETTISLGRKLSLLGGEIITNVLKRYVGGEIKPVAQDNSLSSYAPMLTKEDGRINWKRSAIEIERHLRAMLPWPGSWTIWNDKQLKIISVNPKPHRIDQYRLAEVFTLSNGKLAIQCGIDALEINKVQLEGRTETDADEFLRGYPTVIHSVLT